MEEKPRKAKDISFEEEALAAHCRESDYEERSTLLRKLAFAIELGSLGKFNRLKKRFMQEYGNFNEYEKAGLEGIRKAYMGEA